MKLRIFCSTLVGSLLVANLVLAAETTHVSTVRSPASGEAVATNARVTIGVIQAGHPIVAVRSMEKNSLWWIQEIAEFDGPGRFSVNARFGNDETPDRTRFEIAAMVAPDARAAASMKRGMSLKELPSEFPYGDVVQVVLDRAESLSYGATVKAELLAPLPGGEVQRLQRVSVQMEDATADIPILLVRSVERNSSWWVQHPMQRGEDGTLTGLARIGNEKTLPGSEFSLILAFPNTESIRKSIGPGSELTDLSGFQRSKVFAVTTVSNSDQPISELSAGS